MTQKPVTKENIMNRFKFNEDRLIFLMWMKASPPARNVVYSHRLSGLSIRISKWIDGREYYIEQIFSWTQLEASRLGWRWLVGRELKRMRHALRLTKI